MASDKDNLIFEKTSFLHGNNSSFIKEMYLNYLNNPKSISQSWVEFFDGLNEDQEIIKKEILGPSWAPRKKSNLDIKYIRKDEDKNLSKHFFNARFLDEIHLKSQKKKKFSSNSKFTKFLDETILEVNDNYSNLKMLLFKKK